MPRRRSAVDLAVSILQEASTPLTLQELLAAVEAVEPIVTRNPAATLRGAINNTRLIQSAGEGRYCFLPRAVMGATVRHVLREEDFRRGYLAMEPDLLSALWPARLEIQKRQDRGSREFQLADGPSVSAALEFFGAGRWGIGIAQEWTEWLAGQGTRPGDSLLFHFSERSLEQARVSLEPAGKRDEEGVARRNRAVADLAQEVCVASPSDSLFVSDLAARLLARGAFRADCAADPLCAVLAGDPRFDFDGSSFVGLAWRMGPERPIAAVEAELLQLFLGPSDPEAAFEVLRLIAEGRYQEALDCMRKGGFVQEEEGEVYVDLGGPLGALLLGAEPFLDIPSGKERRQEQLAREVYTFKAAFQARQGFWRRIEIRGDQTLGELDALMRSAFNHDLLDHLSEFHLARGGRWQSQGLGYHSPADDGEGDDVIVGDLGLQPGERLMYVYDFGDYIVHQLTLERIGATEAEVEYPRAVARNRPRYRYCGLCRSRGRRELATWICIECSEVEGREVLVCEECRHRDHEDHYTQEVVY